MEKWYLFDISLETENKNSQNIYIDADSFACFLSL